MLLHRSFATAKWNILNTIRPKCRSTSMADNMTVKAVVNTVLGTNQVGKSINEDDFKIALFKFKQAGFRELDSSHAYNNGKTLEILGRGGTDKMVISTKANPWGGNTLKPECIRYQLETSLKTSERKQFDIFYLHHPDPRVPIEETLRCVNTLYQEGKFSAFGLSNFAAWQVAEVYTICCFHKWVRPTVYQGRYNALNRQVEFELLPCLRHYNIRFYAYSPLAVGLLTGKHKYSDITEQRSEGRFWNGQWKEVSIKRLWKNEYFNGIQKVKDVINGCAADQSITLTEAALRWLYHHSQLSGEYGDAVVLGFSKLHQFESNLNYVSQGKLDDNIVEAFQQLWNSTMYVGLNDKIEL